MERHPNASRGQDDLDVRQMCPECGTQDNFCSVCKGVGTITNDELSVYLFRKQLESGDGH
jgi:hypothetical protein